MKKLLTLSFALAICASLNAQSLHLLSFGMGVPGMDEPQMIGLGISPDGRYVCGTLEAGQGYFVYDVKNDDIAYGISEYDDGAELRNVDNNGVGIGYNGPGVTFSIDNVETILNVPDESYISVLGEDISHDGTTLVGSLIGKGYRTTAAVSRNGGEWTPLDTPTTDYNMSSAKCVSGDGKIIVGYVGSFGPIVIWELDDNGEYVVNPLYQKYVVLTEDELNNDEKPFLNLLAVNISHNGKYILMQALLRDGYSVVPVVLDMETDELTIYSDHQEIDTYYWGITPVAIANDGTFVGYVGEIRVQNSGNFIMKAGETQAQLLYQAYPEIADMLETTDGLGYNFVTDISEDGRYILGYMYYSEDYYDETSNAYYTTYVIDTNNQNNGIAEINSENPSASVEAIFSIDGKRVSDLQKGINVVRMSDGTVKKVIR